MHCAVYTTEKSLIAKVRQDLKTDYRERTRENAEGDNVMNYFQERLGDSYQEGMTEEELSEAMRNAEAEEIKGLKTSLSQVNAEAAAYKKNMDKANSEAAGYKKQLREAQDSAANATSEYEALRQEVDALKRANKISETRAMFISKGYDDALATETATAYADGDMDKVLANQQAYLDNRLKNMQAEIMKATPRPSGGISETNIPSIAAQMEQKYYADKYGVSAKE